MKKEELLKPRFKVIAEYPNTDFAINEIVYVDKDGVSDCYDDHGRVRITMSDYPHLFKKLEWWEERSDSELPKYVKAKSDNKGICRVAILRKIPVEETSRWCMYLDAEHIPYDPNAFEPATEEEYFTQQRKEEEYNNTH